MEDLLQGSVQNNSAVADSDSDSDSDSDEMEVDDGMQKPSKGISDFYGLEYEPCSNTMRKNVLQSHYMREASCLIENTDKIITQGTEKSKNT